MYKLYQYSEDKLRRTTLTDFLQVKIKDVISFAGAGGKTSTIFALAEELKRNTPHKILVTTTTKMFMEKTAVTVEDEKIIANELNNRKMVIAGTDLGAKMGSFSMDFLQKVIRLCDVVLIEADGAQRKPFKMPRSYEPVYSSETTKFVYVMGMSSLGRKLVDLARADILADFLHKQPEEKLTAEDMIKVALSRKGAQKNVRLEDFYLILNQADNEFYVQQAVKIAAVLDKYGIKTAVTCHKI